eukprot:m.65745 g.65745  ORF g.65745 m.65745 type:complete len:496 (-) comp11758_c0_seq1:102-1589(-)
MKACKILYYSKMLLLHMLASIAICQAAIVVDTMPVRFVDTREISVTWDIFALQPGPMSKNVPFNLSDKYIQNLVSELRPFVLRVSGTGCENTMFDNNPDSYVPIPLAVQNLLRPGGGGTKPFNVSIADYRKLAEFAKVVGADLVLGLNLLLRDWPDGGVRGCNNKTCPWNSKNARAWIEYNLVNNFPVYGYELGNEPGCFMPEVNLTGSMVATDFSKLKRLLHNIYQGKDKVPKAIGPDVGGCKHADEMKDILEANFSADILTFHHYVLGGGNSHTYNVSDFIQAAESNTSEKAMESYSVLRDSMEPHTPLWLGEGATTYSQPLDSSYAMAFNYINILKYSGLAGVDVFAKQSLPDFLGTREANGVVVPTSIYWVALAWTRLMGTSVLNTTQSEQSLVVAARSSRMQDDISVVAMVNLLNSSRTLAFQSGSPNAEHSCEALFLDPATTAADPYTLVNGKVPVVLSDGTVPAFSMNSVACDNITLRPFTIAFVSFT